MPLVASTLPSLLTIHVENPGSATPEHRQPRPLPSVVPLDHMAFQHGWHSTSSSLVRWGLPADELPLRWSTPSAPTHDVPEESPPINEPTSAPRTTKTQSVENSIATALGQRSIGAHHTGQPVYPSDLSPQADLAGVGMIGADLSWVNLRRANLGGADLPGAILYKSDLSGADLSYARLTWMDLIGADLTEAVGFQNSALRR